MTSYPARWRGFLAGAALLGAAALASGCGGGRSRAPSTHLEGEVTLNKQAIVEGTLDFIPQTKGQAPAPPPAAIVDGHYTAETVPLGKVLVRITASKKTGKVTVIPHSDEKIEETVDLIPAKYAKGIPIDVSADKKTHNFELTSP